MPRSPLPSLKRLRMYPTLLFIVPCLMAQTDNQTGEANRGTTTPPPATLDDTVEFFNLVLGVKLTAQEKQDLVAFMLAL